MAGSQSTASNWSLHGRNAIWLVISIVVIGFDIYTKQLATATLDYARPVEVLPFLNWTLLHNPGAAFSFLSDAGGWQRWFFTIVSAVVSIVLLVWLFRLKNENLLAISLALILGGAVGNLIDRVQLGYVVDFISVHHNGWYFPAFNIADSAISIGAVLLLIDSFRGDADANSTAADD